MSLFASATQVSRANSECLELWMFLNRHEFTGKTVLDYGCGKQPYREIIEDAGGEYYGYDMPDFPDFQGVGPIIANLQAHYDVILSNQMLMLTDRAPGEMIGRWREMGDTLLLTVNSGYRQFHEQDHWRWTPAGLCQELRNAGYTDIRVDPICCIQLASDFVIPLSLGAVAS